MRSTFEQAGAGLALMGWTHWPKSAHALYAILREVRDDELIILMTKIGGHPGRIAWAEFGRRFFGISFAVENGSPFPIIHMPCQQVQWS